MGHTTSTTSADFDPTLIDPFDVQVLRSCGCTLWQFAFFPLFGFVPLPDEEDPRLWLASALGQDGPYLPSLHQPKKRISGLPGVRLPQGRHTLPRAGVMQGELVVMRTNGCRHRDAEVQVVAWKLIGSRLRAEVSDSRYQPGWPVVVQL